MKFLFFRKILGAITKCYDYGTNNQVIFIRNGKEYHRFFMPKGLKIVIGGNNNIIKIEKPIRFENVLINLEDNNGFFSIQHTKFLVRDARFHVEKNSKITIGKNCQLKSRRLLMIANSSYNNESPSITIGNNVFIAQNATIRTSDGHTLIDAKTKNPLNPPEDVIIEDNVWITSNCTILKGSHISKGSIVAACSMVNKKFNEENVIIAGSPAKIIKHNITWSPKGYGTYIKNYQRGEENEN